MKIAKLNERELFAAAWLLFLDCPLSEGDFDGLWRLPTYGTRKPAHDDPFGMETILGLSAFAKDPRSVDVPFYGLVRESLTADAFAEVVDAAGQIVGKYAQTVIREFIRCHVSLYDRRFYDFGERIREAERRLAIYADGVESVDGCDAPFDYMGYSLDPTGDVDTLRDAPNASALRHVAWAERNVIRDGGTVFTCEDQKELLKYILAEGFRLGEDVDWAYERILHDYSDDELQAFGPYRLGAYAFWRGRIDWLEDLLAVPQLTDDVSGTFLRSLIDGKGSVAADCLVSAWSMPKNKASQYSFRDFPALMLVLLSSIIADKGVTMMKKVIAILHYINGRQQGGFMREIERVFDESYLDSVVCRRTGLKVSEFDRLEPFSPQLSPVELLLTAALVMRSGLAGLKVSDQSALAVVRNAMTEAHRGGWHSVAATLGTVASGALGQDAESECGRMLCEAKERGGRVFPGMGLCGASRWEEALAAFEKAVKPTKSVKSAKTVSAQGKIWWVLGFRKEWENRVDGICVAFSKRNVRGEGYGQPVPLSGKKLLSGEYDSCLSERDQTIKGELVRDGLISNSGHLYSCVIGPQHLVKLCGADNLLRATLDWNGKVVGELKPVTLTAVESRISVSSDGDGLTVWVDRQCHVEPKTYSLREVKPGRYEVRYCTEDFARLASLVNRYAGGGKLQIPQTGVARFESWLEKAGRDLPFSSSGAGKDAALVVKVALCEPVVRLWHADGELSAHLAVRISKDPDVVVEPSVGLAEKPFVTAKGARMVLKRDFAAEAKAIAGARAALAPFDASRVEANRWTFDGVVEALDALAALKVASESGGFVLEWPEGRSLQLAALVSHGASVSGGETAEDWLSVSGSFKLDDGKVLSFVDLLRNFDSREGAYVKLTDDRYLKLTAALARRVEALKGAGVAKGETFLISPAALPSLEKSARETEADDVLPLPEIVKARLDRIRDAFAEPVRSPEGFKCQMRPYQVDGYEWLSRLASCGIGACLADDMGLGKTIQLIALLLARRKGGTSLVVAPASVVFNWRAEFERFAPGLRVTAVGQNPNADEDDLAAIAKGCDVVVTSYGVLRSREEKFAALKWNVVVLDEAQAIKNHLTQRSKCVRTLSAKFRVVATGTPVENRLSELWSLFDFINPGMLGGETSFAKNYTVRGEATPRLKRLVKPLILRRLKREVLTDLPEKEEITVPVLLGEEERHAYEATRVAALAKLKSGDPQNKLAILAELTRLRRFCCHPSLVIPSVQVSAKLEALENLLENLKNNHHRALVFSQFVDCLSIVRKRLASRGWSHQYLDGSTPKAERERAVAAFQDGEGDFFLISLKAGGMGLNLTAANYVILLDPWWNPAVENQAADRVHRIGQRLPVTVYRLIAQDTIEEKVVNLHAKKTALAEDILASGASSLTAEAMLGLLTS